MAHRLAPQAQADLSTIWIYIVKASGNVVAADSVVDAITERFYLLSQYPRMGRPHDDLRSTAISHLAMSSSGRSHRRASYKICAVESGLTLHLELLIFRALREQIPFFRAPARVSPRGEARAKFQSRNRCYRGRILGTSQDAVRQLGHQSRQRTCHARE
jgi:plasmid stabilization system protein ParE